MIIAPSAKLRSLKSDRSTTGSFSVASHTSMNASDTTAISASATMNVELNQSRSLPRSSIICRHDTPITSSAIPIASIRCFDVFVSRPRSRKYAQVAEKMPIGRLM